MGGKHNARVKTTKNEEKKNNNGREIEEIRIQKGIIIIITEF